jgi:peptide/nickel transport system substrate-binding protein
MSNQARRKGVGSAWAMAIAGAIGLVIGAADAQTLKVVVGNDLKSVDPIWTTDQIVGSHAFMIYDQLFAEDSNLLPHPQMVESWTASADGMSWRFVLRPGLKWHDGTAVTAKDVAPSIRRWGARIAAGQSLMSRVAEVVAIDDKTFEIKLKEKFGPVVNLLGASAQPLYIMREKDAMTEPFTAVTETVGSGPFVFIKEEWVPGSKVAYRKNADYVPRKEAPDGYAGGKVAKLARVEWNYNPDPATAVQALIVGEFDLYEYPPTDLLPLLAKSPDITVEIANKFGFGNVLRPNHLVAPTNNPKIRQAMLYATDQGQVLDAMVGNKDLQSTCWAVFGCGTPLDSKAGLGSWVTPGPANIAKAKSLMAEAGYKGEPIVVMNPTTDPQISAMAVMSANQLKEAGFNVDLQNMDWATLVQRRAIKDDPAANRSGWHVFYTWGGNALAANPLTNNTVATQCDGKNWFGWPCDEALEKIRAEFAGATSDAQRKDIADRFQARFYEVVPFVPMGRFQQKIAYRKNVSGVLGGAKLPFWNIEKK